MATLQGKYSSILGGVSEQVYTERQPSQVSEQVNMTSDTVRGLRKRPGTRIELDVSSDDADTWSLGSRGHLRQYTANLGWGITTFIVNTKTGVLTSIVETETMQIVGQKDYLIADDPGSISFTTVGSTMYVCNSEVKPTLTTDETRMNPDLAGFYFIVAGSYGREYNLTITTGTGTITVTYTTPNAGDSNSAAYESSPTYINAQLVTQILPFIGGTLGLKAMNQNGSYLYITMNEGYGALTMTTGTGVSYAIASGLHTVDATTKLPAQLVDEATGFTMTVGDKSFKQYYSYNHSEGKWSEVGEYGSPTAITASTMPLSVVSSTTSNQHEFQDVTWAGREAGDDDNNEVPAFADSSGVGITGMATFQGRLILFSGPYISMSSSNPNYKNYFFRTTVTQVLDSDRIEFTSVSFSGAEFTYGIPFNSDLILVSAEHQGVIPGRSSVLTPNNATAVLTSTYQMATDVPPVVAGRSLYYSYPRSNSSFSIKEMTPSGYTELQYNSQDTTDHLPTYLEGAVLFSTASTTNNIVVLGSTTATDTLYINEYMWSGDSKVQSSWHRWVFDGTLHAAWFVREVLHVLIERDGAMRMLTLSLRDSPNPTDAKRFMPAMDFCVDMPVSNYTAYEPYITFNTDGLQALLWDTIVNRYQVDGDLGNIGVSVVSGDYIGAEQGIKSLDEANRRIILQPGYGVDNLYVGVRFTSTFSPTPPSQRDQDGNYVDVDKLVIQHYLLTTCYTGVYQIVAKDRGGTVWDGEDAEIINFNSQELDAAQTPLDARFKLMVRVGLEAETSDIVFTSNALADFNLIDLGFIVKYNNRFKRI